MKANILLIDDDEGLCDLIAKHLESLGHSVRCAHSAEEGLRVVDDFDFDVVITDISMPGMSGIDFCRQVHARHESVPVVVMSAYSSLERAIDAIRAGAYDFITKPFELDFFSLVVGRALNLNALMREVARLRSSDGAATAASDLLGSSPEIERVKDLISRIGDTESTVLITGESGTGKELVAKAIHDCSGRRTGPFVAINCAAMPESLLESELFGHARGAFTDATSTRAGLFVRANRGTIFLDEIGDMPLGMQAKLLRAVQERRVRPVGSDREVPFDARIIAATHHDLAAEVADHRFRDDLYYRINVVNVRVPPLRARGHDALILAQRFLEQSARQSKRNVHGMSPAVAQKILAYPWPGNVRELQNCMERAVAVARQDEITLRDLPDDVRGHLPSKIDLVEVDAAKTNQLPSMGEVEQRYIQQVVAAVAGNKTRAAQILGLDRRTLYRKLERISRVSEHA